MSRDKQLIPIELSRVIERRRLDQALNAKEFATLAGISYSSARGFFGQPGFPVIRGVVFWSDFVEWRRKETGLSKPLLEKQATITPPDEAPRRIRFTGRAAQILAEAG